MSDLTATQGMHKRSFRRKTDIISQFRNCVVEYLFLNIPCQVKEPYVLRKESILFPNRKEKNKKRFRATYFRLMFLRHVLCCRFLQVPIFNSHTHAGTPICDKILSINETSILFQDTTKLSVNQRDTDTKAKPHMYKDTFTHAR